MTQIIARLFLAALLVNACGCQYALAQPGQTPQQVHSCTVDATAANALTATAGVLTTGAGVEGTVATQETGKTAQGVAIAVPITAGLGAGALLVASYFSGAYAADGCAPRLSGSPPASVVSAPVSP